MFLDFYRLREQPFGATPDPRYLFLSTAHREALASLIYGVETGRGFVALIAHPGMGKTILLFQLMEWLRRSSRTAFLFQTQCSSHELLRYLLADLGLDSQQQDLVRMHGQLNELLVREAQANRRVVLVIDEAQNLQHSVLETVRLLSNFETPSRKLLQIVLAGQPEFAGRLAQPALTQLRERIAVLGRLKPLSAAETIEYINHRLRIAGYQGDLLFTPAALEIIAERSLGIPRNINNLCFGALSLGCATGRRRIDPKIVQEVIGDISVNSLLQEMRTAPQPVASAPTPLEPTQESQTARRLLGTVALAALVAVLIMCSILLLGKSKNMPGERSIPAVVGASADPTPSANQGRASKLDEPQTNSPAGIVGVEKGPDGEQLSESVTHKDVQNSKSRSLPSK